MSKHTIHNIVIDTTYRPSPIPDRRFDWEAIEDDYDLGSPVGHGATEQEAIDDLIEQLDIEPEPAPKPDRWIRVFDAVTLKHICDMTCNDGHEYDPRIGGSGNIITQEIESPK